MITLHWQWLVFIPAVVILLYLIFRDDESSGIGAGLDRLMWLFALIVFIAVWGGVFWW